MLGWGKTKQNKKKTFFFFFFFFLSPTSKRLLQCMMGDASGISENWLLRKCLGGHKTRCICVLRSQKEANSCKI